MSTLAPDTPPDQALRQIVVDCQADLRKYRAVVLLLAATLGGLAAGACAAAKLL